MSAVIKSYSLSIAERDESVIKPPFVEFKPFSDGWVETEEDIRSLLGGLRWLIENGFKPIVTVFTKAGK